MIKVISSEWVKYRRSGIGWLVLSAPLVTVCVSLWYISLRQAATWRDLSLMFEIWTIIVLPPGAALLTSWSASMEKRGGDWAALRVRPVSPAKIYIGKLTVLLTHALIATLLLTFLAGLGGIYLGLTAPVPWVFLSVAGVLLWIAAIPILALQLCLGVALGTGPALGIGVVGLLLAAVVGNTNLGNQIFWYVPWAWPVRILIAPFLGIAGQSLTAFARYTATLILVGLGSGLLTSGAGVFWFGLREFM